MEEQYSVTLSAIKDEFGLEFKYLPDAPDNILIHTPEVNRPGLPLAGFFDHFERARIQIIGKVEYLYLRQLDNDSLIASLDAFFSKRPVAVIVTTNLEVFPEMIDSARRFKVPLLSTKEATSSFMAALIASLNVSLAPRITRHGVLVEVYGEGILILGDSGVGKSETAIELVKRGHRLIADDAVEIKRVSAKTLVGSAPEIIRHYVELRGIGIVDIRRLFGMGAVNVSEKIDMIINLEPWVQGKMYDRLGIDSQTTEILGIENQSTTIPLCQRRNIAIILEIAAMNNRQKKMGYNTAVEFNKRLMGQMGLTDN